MVVQTKRSSLHQELVCNWQAVSESEFLVPQELLVHAYLVQSWPVVQMQRSFVHLELFHRHRVEKCAWRILQTKIETMHYNTRIIVHVSSSHYV